MPSVKVLVTGAAGFIGFHLSKRLLEKDMVVVGLDNLNDYYDVNLKRDRILLLQKESNFRFLERDVTSRPGLEEVFHEDFDYVVHLAAQAGVRYSIVNPYAYLESNLVGFLNILEQCRHHPPKHFIFASSSSVYGANKKKPFSVHDNVDHPLALYAATKKSNELMAHAYANLYQLPVTGLRFFTVYGPYGRPDMAIFLFTKAILEGRPIDVFNFGNMKRDFTYVDDIVEGIDRLMPQIPTENPAWTGISPDPGTSFSPYRVLNIGNNHPVELMTLINLLEQNLERKAILNFLPLQEGDVVETYADVEDLQALTGFKPSTPLDVGIQNFVFWYKGYYKS